MSFVAVAVVGTGVVGAIASSSSASSAADAQSEAADMSVQESRRQFDLTREILAPYTSAGESGLSEMMALAGASGDEAYQSALQRIEAGPGFQASVRNGEEAILSNASATGGLRGGNTQGALAQFRPQMLAQAVDQRYGQLAGIAQIGQGAAVGEASAALQTGQNVSQAYTQSGAAQAGAHLARGQAVNDFLGSTGSFLLQGGF